ncbi:unnamed protein product [Schistocephalus solidus]|uniref:C2H2-type domain-containing protein n=1 Tax=Schistocephalus solidus TaxID=70667 RepID=A0A183SY54_SCHSO|nr:unnamed protein product [Schistocephalus solidus]
MVDWFDDNDADISKLLAEKNELHKAYMDLRTDATKAVVFRCRSLVHRWLREMKDTWMIRKAEEIQGYVNRNEMNNLFKAIKAIYGPCSEGTAPLLSSDGKTLLTELTEPAWRRSVKTGSAIYEANRIDAAKAKRAARKSPALRTNIVDAQTLPTFPRCQRIFRARIGLVGHLRTQCTNNPTIPISTSNSANPPSDSRTLTRGINSITPTTIETTSIYSSPVTPTTTTTTAFAFTTTTTTISDGDSLINCPQCDRTFTSRIGLVSYLPIHRTEPGETVPGAPTHSRDRRLHCPRCPRAFNYCMGLFDLMRIHDSGIHRNANNTDT